VHGLAGAAAREGSAFRQFVVLDASTMRPRYDSAIAVEYAGVPGPGRFERLADVARGRLGLPRRAAARWFQPAADAIAQLPPSIVLAHNAPVLPWLLRDSPHRIVLYAHNDLLGTYTRAEAARMLGSVAAIVCVSEALAGRFRRALPAGLVDLVSSVPNGADCAQFVPASALDERPGSPMRIMFIGRMVREKGVDVLIEAADRLGRDDLEFVLVGSEGFDRNAGLSPYEQELRRMAASGRGRISFEPFVDRTALPRLLRSADMLVVPSRWEEPSGLTAAEGLATGIPVIASRVGGLPELVGEAGRLVDPDQPAQLAVEIALLADDAELRRQVGLRSREHAVAHDWGWAWANLREVLERL
jgi:glycosyltransferase involved in cell wall biosynthesis